MTIKGIARKIVSLLLSDNFVYAFSEEMAYKRCRHQKRLLGRHGVLFHMASNVVIHSPSSITFGDRCAVNEFVHILARGGVTIGDGVWIANHVSIITETHPTDVEFVGDHLPINIPVTIEDNVWVGSHAVILPGVRLGRSCIVGAGAIVTKDVPPYAIVAGVPAKVQRYKHVQDEVSCIEATKYASTQ